MNQHIDWWGSLNHSGLLIAPDKIAAVFATDPPPLSAWQDDRLRRAVTGFDGSRERLSALLDFMLQNLAELPDNEWYKAQDVSSRWSLRSFTGVMVKPRRIWQGPHGQALPVFVPEESGSRQLFGRLGVGRSRHLISRVVEWLRQKQQPLALVTNGRQWRLIHAGQDYEAWCEWDIDLWFVEGQPGPQVLAWRQLLRRDALAASSAQDKGRLLSAILESRKGQAELSAVLGERVRQAVEELITASHSAIEQAQEAGAAPAFADLYVAGCRIVMRCIITLFAEARNLLPVDNPVYQRSYSLEGLRQSLDRRASGRGNERLAQGRSSWPRLIALFNLIYHGSGHKDLTVLQYGGGLFEPGDPQSAEGISRALALLEGPNNSITDRQVHQILRLLTRTKLRLRQGRQSRLVDAPVDFSALSSEYIGILYEGLLDFELKQAAADDPVVFLAVGNEPALTLAQLESMSDAAIRQLFEALKQKDKPEAGDEDSAAEEDAESPDELEAAEEAEEASPEDEPFDIDAESAVVADDDELTLSADHLARAQAWLEKAADLAGLVRRPRGRQAISAADHQEALARAARQLCARLIAPGQFFLVRWGGTRKGAGTFYTRPQLAGPTVRRTLQPLVYAAVQTEVDARTGLAEVVEWAPQPPEAILALKVCDPAMGSGSFLASALRFLSEALFESLYDHQLFERGEDGSVRRMVDGRIVELLGDELPKLNLAHEKFEEMLRAQLKRHIVERCLYGVDLDPLAVELARMTLWVETMDRALPFGFLDHKLKVGNALVGAWFDTYRDYPAMAWEREGGDKDYQKDKPNNLINHYYIATKGKKSGEKRGDKFTAAISARAKAVPEQLTQQLRGQIALLEPTLNAHDVHDELLMVFRELHRLPVHESDQRAALYRDKILNNPKYHALRARLNLWCALWFWPGDQIDQAPLPRDFSRPSAIALTQADEIARERRFFHWELEFPDVFTVSQPGFDAVLGNPPWETMQPSSKEFFSNHDPLYRAYGKQEALAKQLDYFRSYPELENAWIQYIAGFKAIANWMNKVGQPFGDNISTDKDGNKKHDLNLGGRGKNSFSTSAELHKKWSQQRSKRTGFADPIHPFIYQGAGKPYLHKMFLEISHALLRPQGRMGMIVPSGIYTDKGTAVLRTLFLDHCDWQWLFSFENRDGIFDIHRSFKFCPLIIQKGGTTGSIRTAFMRNNIDDWMQADRYVLAYPRERVMEFSPYIKAILEISEEKDLFVLQKIYSNGILLADQSKISWGVCYKQGDFNMTSDSKLFPPLPKWKKEGYQSDEYGHWLKGSWQFYNGPTNILDRPEGIILSEDGKQSMKVKNIEDIAIPTYNAKMFELWDHSSSGWVSGKGRGAVWTDLGFPKVLRPEYLMSLDDYLANVKDKALVKICFKDISTAIHQRTMIASLVPDFPALHAAPILICSKLHRIELLQTVIGSLVFDYVAKLKIGYLHLSYFIIAECPLVRPERLTSIKEVLSSIALRLGCPSELFAPLWHQRVGRLNNQSWRGRWAITLHERLRLKVILDACMAYLFGLKYEDYQWLLFQTDYPKDFLAKKSNTKLLDQKRFWRIDKDQDAELRHTVLSLVAFNDLLNMGIERFLSQNNGEGWLIPENIRLADYGLGHDERAKVPQSVASRLGPRFYDWQLNEDVERSWQECAAHAELIGRIVPMPDTTDDEDGATGNVSEESGNYPTQKGFF